MTVEELLRTKRTAILDIVKQYGVTNVRVFGSAARGETQSDSDLDLLVELPPDLSLLTYVALKQDLEDLLGMSVDIATEDSLHWRIRDSVLREAVAL